MRVGERAPLRGALRVAAALVGLLVATGVAALDNPDRPDLAAAFEQRAAPFESRLASTDGGSEAARAGQAYEEFLDAELNVAYRALLASLQGPAREALVESQRSWLRFRDAEYAWIARRWTRERVGSSATLSVAGYRTALVKERVVRLLRYGADS